MPNIGPIVEQQLYEVDMHTYKDLKEVGSKQAWLHIKAIDDSACIQRLYALEGAIRGFKKALLSAEEKVELKAFYNAHK